MATATPWSAAGDWAASMLGASRGGVMSSRCSTWHVRGCVRLLAMTELLYDVTPPHGRWMLSRLLIAVPLGCAAAAVITLAVVFAVTGVTPVGFLCLAASGVGTALMLRARWAGTAFATVAAVAGAFVVDEPVGFWTITVFCLFVFSVRGRGALPAGAVAASLIFLALARHDGTFLAPSALVAAALCLAAAATGTSVRLQRDAWATAQQRLAEAAAAREAQFDRALVEERLRIARDLHDTVGHEIAVVSINVSAAEVAVTANPQAALASLHAAREAAQRTLQETQQILRLLRAPGADEAGGDRSEPARAENIASLVQRVRHAGGVVHADIDLGADVLSAEATMAAYRAVQEGLTNAQRHGEGPTILHISPSEHALRIHLRNRIRPHSLRNEGRGFGLIGMRERVASAGGSVEHSESEGWFEVLVTLPTNGPHA